MAKSKRPFTMNYPQYEGEPGSPEQWRDDFQAAMGFDEAYDTLRGDSPRAILGVTLVSTWVEVLSAYRKRAMECHPDRCMIHHLPVDIATARFKKLLAAFTVLKAEYKK